MEPNLSASVDEIPGPVVDHGVAHIDAYGTIDDLLLGSEASTGVGMDALGVETRLLVRTRYSQYRLTVLDGESGEVLIEGGNLLHGVTPATLNGATAGGRGMKVGRVGG